MAAYRVPYSETPPGSSIDEDLVAIEDEEPEAHYDEDDDDLVADGFDLAVEMEVEASGSSSQVGARLWIPREERRRQEQARGRGRGGKRHNVVRSDDEDALDSRAVATGAGPSATAAPRRVPEDDGYSSDSSGNQPPNPHVAMQMVDASVMPDYNPRHLGKNITPKVPCFRHGTSNNSTWMSYAEVMGSSPSIRPVRVECWQIPASLFARDGTRFRHWCTPAQNTLRANQIAAILGMAFAPTSKGFL
jgi:hypothetical protein